MLCNVIETSVSKGMYLLKACMCHLADSNWCCIITNVIIQISDCTDTSALRACKFVQGIALYKSCYYYYCKIKIIHTVGCTEDNWCCIIWSFRPHGCTEDNWCIIWSFRPSVAQKIIMLYNIIQTSGCTEYNLCIIWSFRLQVAQRIIDV